MRGRSGSLGLYLIIYNTKKVAAADAPKSWKDVLDPKWKDQLAIGHPGYSGSVGIMCVLLKRMYGWDYFKALEKNKPQIGRSSDDPVTLLNAGERNVGVGVSMATPLLSIARGNPLAIVYPTEGTEAVFGPSAIPKNAPHPNAARLFMEFATGPIFSQVLRKYFIMTVRPDVPAPEGALPLDKVKLLTATPKEIEEGVPEVKELWRDTFGCDAGGVRRGRCLTRTPPAPRHGRPCAGHPRMSVPQRTAGTSVAMTIWQLIG